MYLSVDFILFGKQTVPGAKLEETGDFEEQILL